MSASSSDPTLWGKVYPHNGTQDGRDVCVTLSGSEYLVAGRSLISQQRPFLLKTNSSGQELWYYEYGPWSLYDAAWCLTPTQDGGFVMGGKVQHEYGVDDDDILVFKTNSSGTLLWKKEHDIAGHFDRMWDILELSDGSLVGCGSLSPLPTYHDAGLIKMNSQGDILWYRCYGQAGTTEDARTLTATSDGGFLIGGYYGWNGDGNNMKCQLYVIKTDANGNLEWSKTLGDVNAWNTAEWVGKTRYGNYIIAGRTGEVNYGTDGWVLKLNPAGDILWQKTIGGDYNDWFTGGIIKEDETCILVGLTQSYSSDPGSSVSNRDGWAICLNSNGDTRWEEVYGSPGSQDQFGRIDGSTKDNRYIAGGFSGNDVYLVKMKDITYNSEDLIVRNPNGDMLLFPFENEIFFVPGTLVGWGWNFTHYFVGYWTGDGTHDMITRKSNGELYLYPFRNDTFLVPGSGTKVGENFNYTNYFVGNWTNDGSDDLIVRTSSGNMLLFPFRNGTFNVPGAGKTVGNGWNFTHYFVGYWTGDGTHDLVTRKSNGELYLYPFRNDTFYIPGSGKKVGTGFINYTPYLVGQWTND